LDDLRQTALIRGRNAAPQIEFFFAPANKRPALAPDLIGIYFGYFFFLGRRKRKPNKEQITLRIAQTLPLKKSNKVPNWADQRSLMTILGLSKKQTGARQSGARFDLSKRVGAQASTLA
jgi:hypothetical protein